MSKLWIDELNSSDSRLHKEEVLKRALSMTILGDGSTIRFLGLLKMCYNPFVTFGIRQVPSTSGITGADNPWPEFESLLNKLAKRELSGHAARDAIAAISGRFDSDEWNVFCRPVILKDIRAGISEKTINKICKRTEFEIPVFGCQLATSCEDRPEMKGEKRLEPKLDGVRALFMVEFIELNSGLDREPKITCYSRNGKVFENFDHISDQLAAHADTISKKCKVMGHSMHDGFVLDGEVIGKSFNELMKQARRKSDVAATDSIFYVFDVLPLADFRRGYWNAQLEKRISTLEEMRPLFDRMDNVDLLPHLMVDLDTAEGRDQFRRYANDQVNLGFEGIMIKELKAAYECRRSTFWLKWKPVITVDLEVIDVEEGTGKNVGRLGALVCSGVDGGKTITVNVGSGFSDLQRDDIWLNRGVVVRQTAEVMADAVSRNQDGTYSLRFPRFVRFRDDK
jgi:DNA ligase-1